MPITTIAQRVSKIIQTYGMRQSGVAVLSMTDDLFDSGWLDSFSAISVIAILEEEFDYSFSPVILQSAEMRTISGISRILSRRP
jgi:acyl carrier protein